MKKTKWLKSLGVAAALAMPATTVLTTLTSCGRKLYTELVSEMKDSLIETFIDLSAKTHRDVWNEHEAFTYVRQHMASMGYKPAGYDMWSKVPEVIKQRDLGGDTFRGDYGNIWFDIPASSGYSNAPGIIIHAHMDSQMVFAGGQSGSVYQNWIKDASEGGCTTIDYDQSNEILETKNNTMSMGGDGGIGIAVLLTIAKYQSKFNHGRIRLLFAAGESEAVSQLITVGSEEKTVDYAAGYSFLERDQWYEGKAIYHDAESDPSYLDDPEHKPFGDLSKKEFKYIISAAGIVKNTIMVSSAGIHECAIHALPGTDKTQNQLSLDNMEDTLDHSSSEHPYEWTKTANYYTSNKLDWDEQKLVETEVQPLAKHCFTLKLSGLVGGTSSLYINSGHANALSMLMQILELGDDSIQIINVKTTPDSAYSICDSAEITFTSMYNISLWQTMMNSYLSGFKKTYTAEDWNTILSKGVSLVETDRDVAATQYKVALSKKQSRGIIKLLASDIPYGPRDWFDSQYKQVKTSINVGPLLINIPTQPTEIVVGTTQVPAEFKLNVVERSAETNHLFIFYNMIHLMLHEQLEALLSEASPNWEEKIVSHISNPVWEPPTKEYPNILASAFATAYKNFELNATTSKEHGWVEIACTPQMFTDHSISEANIPQMVLIGPDILWNHSRFETIYSETIVSVIETIVYVLDHTLSLLK